eukprot:TRINITY_DN8039_c0_g1_i1.p1 TRINITY_DN8039_c0_g1~~TRINITY_DN8039_c0_g1_i1.p1  ORF type:complete len:236 (-),score=52.22 TRINITY_DN8039_c0_g1_i1:101-808(-)
MQEEQADLKLIDALPYFDDEFNDNAIKAQVWQLLEEEMRSFQPPDYLAQYPSLPPLFDGTTYAKLELERLSRNEKMKPLDQTRYLLPGPRPNKKTDVKSWENALTNAQSQLEHQYLRLINLELLNNYGANTWHIHNESLKKIRDRASKMLTSYRNQIDDINRKRRSEQVVAGKKIHQLQNHWEELCKKNIEIDFAIQKLEAEISELNKQVEKHQDDIIGPNLPLTTENQPMAIDL